MRFVPDGYAPIWEVQVPHVLLKKGQKHLYGSHQRLYKN